MGNQAAQIKLQELAQAESQRQFNVTNEQAWRQNPTSVFDRVYNNRTAYAAPAPAPAPATAQSAYAAPQPMQTQSYAPPAAMQPASTSGSAYAGQGGYNPQGPLSYGEIRAAGAEPPAIAAATAGQPVLGAWHPAGAMPVVSAQALNQLSPTEKSVFDAQLRTTGNDPQDYAWNRQRMTAAPIRTSAGYSAPRRMAAAAL